MMRRDFARIVFQHPRAVVPSIRQLLAFRLSGSGDAMEFYHGEAGNLSFAADALWLRHVDVELAVLILGKHDSIDLARVRSGTLGKLTLPLRVHK